MASQLFTEATSENAVSVLRKAIREFGAPATILLSDNGACFADRGRGKDYSKTHKGRWKPTAFDAELLNRGIEMINSRPYHHPQTNGKLERFHQSSIENEIWHTMRACPDTSGTIATLQSS